MADAILAYKLAKPDGWDFYTGQTINYRGKGTFPHIVKAPTIEGKQEYFVCEPGVLHASIMPNDCFAGVYIPCSAYRVAGVPICGDESKFGFLELEVLEEILDRDGLFGWRYSEAIMPLNPLSLPKHTPSKADFYNLKLWASVRDSVWTSVWTSVRDSVWTSVGDSVWDPVRDSVRDSVWTSVWTSVRDSVWTSVGDSVWDSVWASVWASVGAYVGYLFSPAINEWKETYPYQPSVDLWRRGLVASFDGTLWRLHSGRNADIVWEGEIDTIK